MYHIYSYTITETEKPMETTEKLMEWVKEYGIETEIKTVLAEDGYEAALDYIRQWFEGDGESDAILEQYT